MITIDGKDISAIVIDNKEVVRISDYLTGDIMWEKVPVNYFYIQNIYSGTNTVTITSTALNTPTEGYFTRTLQYSKDRRVWTTVVLEHQVSTTITLNQDEKVYFRNTNGKLNYDNTVEYFYTSFSASQSHIVGGNIESLVDYRNIGRINYQYSGTYSNLFRDDTTLTSASGLIMPENNLSASCMSDMFRGCTSLTDTPDLPATTLSKYCYQRMFAECRSLTETPDLPATSVQDGVYWSMFRNCTSLTDTHELNLKVLTKNCYNNMFAGCTSLVDAPVIDALVYGESSCEWMFKDCTSLSSMQVNADDASATNSTRDWLKNVAPTGVFGNTGLYEFQYPSPSGVPQGWRILDDDYFYVKNDYSGSNAILLSTDTHGSPSTGYATSVQYSKDKQNWSTLQLNSNETVSINLNDGETVYLRNDSGKWSFVGTNTYRIISIYATNNYKVGGNINSLLDYTDKDNVILPNYCFTRLFGKEDYMINSNLVDARDVILPKNLSEGCFAEMFENCTSITSAAIPSLPSTTLARTCYRGMFRNCTSLTTAPSLPATTLYEACYSQMFNGCTSLTTAPTLPSTALAPYCYNNMFNTCTSLTTAPTLPATTMKDHCYYGMFAGCTSLTTTPTLPSTSLATYCYSFMFGNCTSLTTPNALPATTLANHCYDSMFKGCTSLTVSPDLVSTTLVNYCYYEMFSGCTILNEVSSYANNISATNCLYNWLNNVSATGTFFKKGSASYSTGASGIPSGWNISSGDYFYIENTYAGSNTVSFTNISVSPTGNYSDRVQYSKNKSTWTTLLFTANGTQTITLNQGEKVYLRNNSGNFNWYNSDADNYRTSITCSQSHTIGGNIGTLLDYTNDSVSLSQGCFMTLFKGNNTLTDASALTLSSSLSKWCFRGMFNGCTSLTTAPALPATSLSIGCYQSMFYNCTSLTTTPTLMARTLVVDCYKEMFRGCTVLNDVRVGADYNSASKCLSYWLYGVSATGTFHNLGFASYSTGASGIPSGWTVVYS